MLAMTSEDLIRDALLGSSQIISPKLSKVVEVEDLPPRSKRRKALPDNIENWITANFVSYTLKTYRERYKQEWELNFRRQCQEVLYVRDELLENLGFCDNKVLKDYIDWFFKNCADDFMQKYGAFYFVYLRRPKVIDAFVQSYRYTKNEPAKTQNLPKVEKPVAKADFSKMAEVFRLSEEEFVRDYGVLLPIAWLVSKKQYTLRDAAIYVFLATQKAYKNGKFSKVKEATERLSPYPKSFAFKEANALVKKVNPTLEVCVDFTDSPSPEFDLLK